MTPQSHTTQPAYLHTNGHAGGQGNGHAMGAGLNEYQLETCTPMLSSIPGENEHSDSKVSGQNLAAYVERVWIRCSTRCSGEGFEAFSAKRRKLSLTRLY